MTPRLAATIAALACTTGCWIDTCETYDPDLRVEVCTERLSGVFDGQDDWPAGLGWCSGAESSMTTCEALGYTGSCLGASVRPADALLPQCL